MRIDLHNHTYLCNHAQGSMEEYILKAIELKIDAFKGSGDANATDLLGIHITE